MGKMAHCLVGSWDTSFEVGEDLRDWGTKLAKLWCLKGNLGIVKMERGKALLEFGILAEAEKALKIGGFSCLGSPLNLQKWRPECGCLQEGNKRSEAWVRVLGLPVSMWERDTLKRIGDACGGFIDVDHQTEMLEDLQWARILVKIKQERLPNEMEIRTEDHRYVLSLWWELRPTVRKVREEKGKGILVSDGEDGGEGYARVGGRVRGLVGGSSLEVRLQTDDGTRGQSSGMGLTAGTDSDLVSDGPHELCGLAKQWAVGPHEVSDSALPCDSGLIHIGLPSDAGRAAKKKSIGGDGLGSQGRARLRSPWSCLTVKNGLWRPSNEEQRVVKNSMTDDALMEEALRYGTAPNYYGPLVCVPPSPPSYSYFSGRTPLGECYDRSGVGLDASQRVILDRRMGERTFAAMKPMDRWEMGEDNNSALGACGQDLCLVGETVPEIRDWREASWEESELARKALFKEEGASLQMIYEVKAGASDLEVSLIGGHGAQGSAGGILVCWDKRSLELLELEVGFYSISCKLKTVENDVVWVFTGVYGPCNRKERELLWEELGAIRGIWDEPWCIGGDFNVTLSQRDRSRQGSFSGAMRRFAQVVDDLALIDLPLQGGVYSWSGGRNNQTWARLDRFLVSQGWLDIFRGAVQCRLPRPTSDHFPILLKGGGMSRGPSPFRFENMWLKVEGFKELLREWWQGGERVGRASFRLAAKMKFWDRVESGRDLSEREVDMKNEAKENFKKWVLLEEAHWRQMSRELWLREGDKNTGFFHKMASAHWRNNFLDRIIINGEELVEEQEVREGIVKAFQQQLREEPGWRADLGGLHLKSLDHSEAEALEVPFTEEEIFAASDGDEWR
ncbi:hypothetical protein CK203_069209 [Vitis vinifera]|uniref:Uncharacterized protein n=1 Tax=Vitis vinifera TaxID=29760 RepID=A0A438C240_VITVI|nr:hypothetical protein CK203_069209 [Vitis vinifera]